MPSSRATLTAEHAHQIGIEAYIYFYPLVLMDVTRRVTTNAPLGKKEGFGPMNGFSHFRKYPSADFREVVRPNFDTLYSSLWLDLTREPMIVSVPDTAERYYLLPMLDMWTDVFAVPGKRTSGTSAANFAVVPPGWHGELPEGVEAIQAPTRYVWIIGRTQTNGPSDYEAVHKVQDGYRTTPLSKWPSSVEPINFELDPSVDMKTSPMEQVNTMAAEAYFSYAAELMKLHAPHVTDWSTMARVKHIGIEPGKSFSWEQLTPDVQEALRQAAVDGLKSMYAKVPTLARVVNGWQMNTDTMGAYGNYYLKRAIVALVGLGANQPEDAIYPFNNLDASGQPVLGENNYVLRFRKEELPPVDAFWSLTMYDTDGFAVANPIDRYAIGDRDSLTYNADGSLDLYIQSENPGPEKAANWLPSPPQGTLGMTMRLYAPKTEALDGRWAPPAIQRTTL